MSERERLSADLQDLGMPSWEIPIAAEPVALRKLIARRCKDLMEQFPPGTFVTLDDKIHLIKTYSIHSKGTAPDECMTHSYSDDRNCLVKIKLLRDAVIAEPANSILRDEAQYWRERHIFKQKVEQCIHALAISNERLMLDLAFVERIANDFLQTHWPASKSRNKPAVVLVDGAIDALIEDFVKHWIKKREH